MFDIDFHKELQIKSSEKIRELMDLSLKYNELQYSEAEKIALQNYGLKIPKKKIKNKLEYSDLDFKTYQTLKNEYPNSLIIHHEIFHNILKKYALKTIQIEKYNQCFPPEIYNNLDQICEKSKLTIEQFKNAYVVAPYFYMKYKENYNANLFLKKNSYYIQIYQGKTNLNITRIFFSWIFRTEWHFFIYMTLPILAILYKHLPIPIWIFSIFIIFLISIFFCAKLPTNWAAQNYLMESNN